MTNDIDINYLYPITSVLVHRNGHLSVKRSPRFKPTDRSIGNKGKIRKLSKKSLRRLNHIMQCTSTEFKSMITLTYGRYYPREGTIVKQDLKHMMYFVKSVSESWLWFLEFQKRGAPHIHILTTVPYILPSMHLRLAYRWVIRQADSPYFQLAVKPDEIYERLKDMVVFNMRPEAWEVIRKKDGARRYVSKYASKQEQKAVPVNYQDVGRFWGCSKDVREIEGVEVELTVDELMLLLEQHNHKCKDMDVLPRYLWGVMNEES